MNTRTITIVGLRQVGMSIALALKASSLELILIGHDSDNQAQRDASALGVLDKVEPDLIKAAAPADILVLAVPAQELAVIFSLIGDKIQSHTVVLDLAEIKGPGIELADRYLRQGYHVGARPVLAVGSFPAGSVEALQPRADLFQNSLFCVLPSAKADPEAVDTAVNFGKLLGATPYFLDPLEYDNLAQAVETLPGLAGIGLFRAVQSSSSWRDILRFAGLPFFQATAPLDTIGKELAFLSTSNKTATLRWLDALVGELNNIRTWIIESDEEILDAQLFEQQREREAWLKERLENKWVEDDSEPIQPVRFSERIFGGLMRKRGD